MPIFDFQCPNCEKIEEVFFNPSEVLCSNCHVAMNKLLSAPAALHFDNKGGTDRKGWVLFDRK